MIRVLIGALLFVAAAAFASAEPAEEQSSAADVDRIWIRVPKTGGIKRSANRSGQLEIREDALRFIGRKKTVELPFESIRTVSFGRMEGDVDTEWTVLEIDTGDGRALYGLRDGSKLGFGGRTRAIHERLIETMRSHAAAQYDVPDGTRLYDAFDWQFTAALPDDWAARLGELIYVGDRAPWGGLLFVPRESLPQARSHGIDPSLITRVRRGAIPAITVERRQAPRGARCSGFKERARRAILEHLVDSTFGEPAFAAPLELLEQPASVDGCAALRMTAEGASGTTSEIRAVVFGDVLFLFGLRHGSQSREAYETLLQTLRFAKSL